MKTELNSLSLSSGVLEEIKRHFMRAFAQAEDELLEIMEREIMQTVHGNGPGKPAWRDQMREKLEVVEEIFCDAYLEAKVGLDENMALTELVKAMIIAEGAGSAGESGQCIVAGPAGRSVWDDDISGKHPSKVQTPYMLPPGFNQSGNHFVQNAMTIMRSKFRDILTGAMSSLPDSVLSKFVIVSKR